MGGLLETPLGGALLQCPPNNYLCMRTNVHVCVCKWVCLVQLDRIPKHPGKNAHAFNQASVTNRVPEPAEGRAKTRPKDEMR